MSTPALTDLSHPKSFDQLRLSALTEIPTALITSTDTSQLLQKITDLVPLTLPAYLVSLSVFDLDAHRITQFITSGIGADQAKQPSFADLLSGSFGRTIRDMKPVLLTVDEAPDEISNILRNPEAFKDGLMLITPIYFRDQNLGILTAINPRKDSNFTEPDIRFMIAIASQCAIAISNAQVGSQTPVTASERTQNSISNATDWGNHSRYRLFVENMSDGLAEINRDLQFTYTNQKFCDLLGYTADELSGQPLTSLLDDENCHEFNKQITKRRSGERSSYQLRWNTKAGRKAYTLVAGTPLFDQEGHFQGSFAVVTDIAERMQAQERLEQERTLLRTLIDAIPDDIYIKDIQSHFIEVNSAVVWSLGGKSREDIVGKSDIDFHSPEMAAKFIVDEQRVLQSGQPSLNEENHFLLPGTGKDIWHLISRVPWHDSRGKIIGFIGINRDITERKLVEQKLEESEKRLRLTLEAAQIGVWDWDLKNDQWYASPLYYTMLGYEPKTEFGNRSDWIDRVHPDDRDLVSGKIQDILAHNLSEYQYEARIRHFDGTYRWQHAMGFGIERDGNGKITRMLGIRMDITGRKRTEDALRASEERFSKAFRLSPIGTAIFRAADGRFVDVNDIFAKLSGYTSEEIIGHTAIDLNLYADYEECASIMRSLQEKGSLEPFEFKTRNKSGKIGIGLSATTEIDLNGEKHYLSLVLDITERKRAEEERREHLWLLESMDHINKAIQGTSDLKQMLSDVLDTALNIFECDRAWLVDPCDPNSPTWQVPMERTRIEYPGVLPLGVDLPLEPSGSAVFRILRDSPKPVQFGPNAAFPVPHEVAEILNVKAFMATAFYPKLGKPWALGLHQCSHPRVWTPIEERLLQEMGRRLGDALTSLLAYRNLQESERQLIEAQRIAHVGHWDWDAVHGILKWSDETYRIFGLEPQLEPINLDRLRERIHPEDYDMVVQALADAEAGIKPYEVEYRVVRPDGTIRHIYNLGEMIFDEFQKPLGMLGTLIDITERKQAQEDLQRKFDEEATLQAYMKTLHKISIELTLIDGIDEFYKQVIQLGLNRLGFDRMGLYLYDPKRNIALGTYGTDMQGHLMPESQIQFELETHGGMWNSLGEPERFYYEEVGDLHHNLQVVGTGWKVSVALWFGDRNLGWLVVDNLIHQKPISKPELEVLAQYGMYIAAALARKQAEEKLRLSESKYRSLIQKVHTAIVLHDSDGRILSVNPLAQRMLKMSTDTLSNGVMEPPKWHFLRENGSDMPVSEFPVNMVLASKKPLRDYVVGIQYENTTEPFWAVVNAEPEFDDAENLIQIIVSFIEITERKQFEGALQRYNRRLSILREIDHQILFASTPQSIANIVLKHLSELIPCEFLSVILHDTDLTEERIFALQHTPDLGGVYTQDIQPVVQNEVLEKLKSGKTAIAPDLRKQAGPHALLAEELESHGVRSALASPMMVQGKLIGTIALAARQTNFFTHEHQQITEEVSAQIAIALQQAELKDQIAQYNAELEQRVHDRTLQLESANRELELFSYSVSHDLRAPLRSIQGFSEIIARRHKDKLNDEGRHYFDNIITASEQMDQLITDLLDYARIGRQNIHLSLIPLDIVLSDVIDTLKSEIEEASAQITLASDLPTVVGDRSLLKRIFTNLLGNAILYRRPQSVPTVQVDSISGPEYAIIRVIDNGIGIAPEFREKIFNIFQRLHSQEDYPGTGIGLAIVRKSVELLDGSVWVENAPQAGSMFCIKLRCRLERQK